MFTTTDITRTTSNVTGTKIINTNSHAALAVAPDFTALSIRLTSITIGALTQSEYGIGETLLFE